MQVNEGVLFLHPLLEKAFEEYAETNPAFREKGKVNNFLQYHSSAMIYSLYDPPSILHPAKGLDGLLHIEKYSSILQYMPNLPSFTFEEKEAIGKKLKFDYFKISEKTLSLADHIEDIKNIFSDWQKDLMDKPRCKSFNDSYVKACEDGISACSAELDGTRATERTLQFMLDEISKENRMLKDQNIQLRAQISAVSKEYDVVVKRCELMDDMLIDQQDRYSATLQQVHNTYQQKIRDIEDAYEERLLANSCEFMA